MVNVLKKYFLNNDLGNVLKNFKNSKNNLKRNKILVDRINSGLKHLKEETTSMSKEEEKSKKQMK